MSEADTIRELVARLKEPRLGTHYVRDENDQETGETVDEYKALPQLQAERDEAAAALTALERRAEHWKERTQQVFAERDDAINEKHAAWSRADAAERRAEQAEKVAEAAIQEGLAAEDRAEQAEREVERLQGEKDAWNKHIAPKQRARAEQTEALLREWVSPVPTEYPDSLYERTLEALAATTPATVVPGPAAGALGWEPPTCPTCDQFGYIANLACSDDFHRATTPGEPQRCLKFPEWCRETAPGHTNHRSRRAPAYRRSDPERPLSRRGAPIVKLVLFLLLCLIVVYLGWRILRWAFRG